MLCPRGAREYPQEPSSGPEALPRPRVSCPTVSLGPRECVPRPLRVPETCRPGEPPRLLPAARLHVPEGDSSKSRGSKTKTGKRDDDGAGLERGLLDSSAERSVWK